MSGALQGLVVLDLTRFLAGPYCTLLLAGLGAEVIKNDQPRGGDPTAGAPPFVGPGGVGFERRNDADYGIAYLKRARGKSSMTLDLKRPEGRELLLRLAARLGIDYAALAVRNPRLVYCAISGYGATGPDRELKAYDLMAQAACGLMAITGEPGGLPVKTAGALSDMIAGTFAALGVVAAVHERERSGTGQEIDVSMADCLFALMMDEPLDCYARLGLAERRGNRIMRFSPFNSYPARDGWVALGAVTPEDWRAIAAAIGRADLAEQRDFSRVSWRIAHNAEVDRLVSSWTREHAVDEIVATLRAADVPCSPVRRPIEAIEWPQLRSRGMVQPLRAPDGAPTAALAAGPRVERRHASIGVLTQSVDGEVG